MDLLTTTKRTKPAEAVSMREARRAAAFRRFNGVCSFMTEKKCAQVADQILVDRAWTAFGIDGAPMHALRPACGACASRWKR